MREIRKRMSQKPTFLYFGLGGTIGVALIYIFKPAFLSNSITNDPGRLLEWLLVWWLVSFIGGLSLGQLKISKSDSG